MAAKKTDKPKENNFIQKPKNKRRKNPDPAKRHQKKLGPKDADRVRNDDGHSPRKKATKRGQPGKTNSR
jgi:hypothetical protein